AVTAATAVTSISSTPTAAPSATPNSPSSDLANKIHRKLEKKLGHKHGIIIDGNQKDTDHIGGNDDIPAMVVPLVGIVFLTIFGAPVLIVIVIGLIALVGTRMRQRTIRMMVE